MDDKILGVETDASDEPAVVEGSYLDIGASMRNDPKALIQVLSTGAWGIQECRFDTCEIQDLIDMYAYVNYAMNNLKGFREFLNSRLKAEFEGVEGAKQGREFVAEYSISFRTSFDTDAAKEELGDDWVAGHTHETQVETLRIRPKTEDDEHERDDDG